jgi:hypothetical protein
MADRTSTCTAGSHDTHWWFDGPGHWGGVSVNLIDLPAGTRVTVAIESPEPERPVDFHFHSTIPQPPQPDRWIDPVKWDYRDFISTKEPFFKHIF